MLQKLQNYLCTACLATVENYTGVGPVVGGQQQLQRGGESTDTDEFQGEFTIEVGDRAFTIGLLDTVKQALAKEGGTFAYTLHVPVA